MFESLSVTMKIFLENYGLFAVFVLVFLESIIFFIPSEIIIPFGGFLAHKGYFSIWSLVFFSSLGSLAGAILIYYIGAKMNWLHKLEFLEDHIKISEKFFKKHGYKAVFFGRMLPTVRTFVSFPAGMFKMPFWEFCTLSFIGSIPWNFALGYGGYLLGENWELIDKYGSYLTIPVIILLIIGYFAYKKYEEALEEGKI